MRKVKSFIKKANIKSFILGIAIAVLISFGVTFVLAINSDQGGGETSNGEQSTKTYGFIGQEGGLVNKIGSLTIGKNTDDSWIMDPANKCLTQGNGDELQTCLSVVGSASFSKLTVLDMPAFIQNSSLFLNESGDQSFLAGLPSGLVIDDFAGDDDSIMVSSLQYEVDGNLSPRNIDEQRQLCADHITGKLVPCGENIYHWQTGTWSECSAGGSGTCSGTWTTSGTGSCTGTYQDEYCDGGVIELYDNDPMVEDCRGSIYSCEDSNYQNETSCNSMNGDRCNNNCTWHSNTINCSTLGATNSNDCTASPHESCRWGNGTSATHYCSDKDGTSQSECTGYNSACSWNSGTGNTKTRTVVCKDSSNQTVADSLCSQPKPAIEESCDINPNPNNYSCIGTTPLNSVLCSNDDIGLITDTSKTLVSSCGTPKCEYVCTSGYHKVGDSCIQNNCNVDGCSSNNYRCCGDGSCQLKTINPPCAL